MNTDNNSSGNSGSGQDNETPHEEPSVIMGGILVDMKYMDSLQPPAPPAASSSSSGAKGVPQHSELSPLIRDGGGDNNAGDASVAADQSDNLDHEEEEEDAEVIDRLKMQSKQEGEEKGSSVPDQGSHGVAMAAEGDKEEREDEMENHLDGISEIETDSDIGTMSMSTTSAVTDVDGDEDDGLQDEATEDHSEHSKLSTIENLHDTNVATSFSNDDIIQMKLPNDNAQSAIGVADITMVAAIKDHQIPTVNPKLTTTTTITMATKKQKQEDLLQDSFGRLDANVISLIMPNSQHFSLLVYV